MSEYLYIDHLGNKKTSHSFSGGDRFRFCPAKYKFERIDGYTELIQKAAPLYGVAIENAVRFHHENGMKGGAERFCKEWEAYRNRADIVYNDGEGSWEELRQSGIEHMVLYDLVFPTLPFRILNPKDAFQQRYIKEIFPNTKWSGIDFVAYMDLIAKMKGIPPNDESIIVDMKATGKKLKDVEGIVALDRQLQSYAWISGYRLVGLLVFEKHSRALKQGYTVRLLQDAGKFKAGQRVIIAEADTDDAFCPMAWVVESKAILEEGKKKWPSRKKADEEARTLWIKEQAQLVDHSALTKQDIRFVMGRINERDAQQVGQQIGFDIAAIINAKENNFYPKLGGVRFPNEKCPSCPMLGNCLGDDKLRDTLVKLSTEPWDTPYEREEE